MTKALTCTFCSPFIIARAVKQSYVAIAGLNEKLNAANSIAYTLSLKRLYEKEKNQLLNTLFVFFQKTNIMWNTNTLWFEISIVTIFYLLGNIFLGHFEERSPKWRKLVKYLVTLVIIISLSVFFGRTVALIVLGASLIPVIYVHGIVLPKKGINGWTGEPKSKYYDLRGWDKNIFGTEKNETKSKIN